ncbi:Glycosyl transferase family 2 [Planctomycetes bacterium Pla86]|uniref:Glycosyl transferase family 2 n=2 Tax=Engelhardtia mirabilis TaxID=2528011 RepID=A0A518BKH3_9BACT|nr:Glycosyl transferase family 2 [Planctomycetes bacterium Pla133]QDV01798.1 Glycosyl transferase family 2 [Planctomycetes bacterium Pla86]
MPILNGEAFLERVLGGLAIQATRIPWDFTAADCGSTDRTLAIFEAARASFPVPLRVHGIHTSEFNHGDTRNVLAALTEGELLVFVTDDSIPVGEDWLDQLAENFRDPAVAGAYLRNVPRPEADVLAQVFSEFDPGYQPGRQVTTLPDPATYDRLDGNERRLLYNFNDTASAVRRSFWERHPDPHTDFGEDIIRCRAMLEGGFKVVYDDRAVVHHSHEYGPEETYVRAIIDGAFNAERLDRICLHAAEEIDVQVARQSERDRAALVAQGYRGAELEREVERAEAIRRAYFKGLLEGGRNPKRFRMSTLLPSPRPRVAAIGVPAELEAGLRARGWELTDDVASAEVLHVHGDGAQQRALLASAVAERRPTLWTVSPAFAREHGFAKALLGADEFGQPKRSERVPGGLDLAPKPAEIPLEAWVWRTDAEYADLRGAAANRVVDGDTERLVCTEVRYRALAARARSFRQMDLRGIDADRLEGAAQSLDATRLLLREEGAAAEWDLTATSPGRRELRIFIDSLAQEHHVQMGGQVFLDGEHVANLGPFRGCWADESRALRVPVVLGAGVPVLRLHSGFGSSGAGTLRVSRILVLDPSVSPGAERPLERTCDLRGQDGTPDGPGAVAQECDMVQLGPQRASIHWQIEGIGTGLHEVRVWLYYAPEEVHLQQSGRIVADGLPLASFGPLGPPDGGGHREVAIVVDLVAPSFRLGLINTLEPFGPPGICRVKRVLVRPIDAGTPVRIKPFQRFTRRPVHVDAATPLSAEGSAT